MVAVEVHPCSISMNGYIDIEPSWRNPHRMPVPGTIVEESVIDHCIGGKDVQIKMV